MKRFLGVLILGGIFMFATDEAKAQSSTWGDFRKPNVTNQSPATAAPSSTSPKGAYNARQPEGVASRGGITFNKRYHTYETGQGAFRVKDFSKTSAAKKMAETQERGYNPDAEAYKKRVRKMKKKYNK